MDAKSKFDTRVLTSRSGLSPTVLDDPVLKSDQMYNNTPHSMVRILSEGQQLKLDIHHLREEFQALLSGISDLKSPSSTNTEHSTCLQSVTTQVVDNQCVDNATDVCEAQNQLAVAKYSPNASKSAAKFQVSYADDCVITPRVISPSYTPQQLPIVLDTPTQLPKPIISTKLRRQSEQLLPPKHAFSTTKNSVSKARRHSSISANRILYTARKQAREESDASESPFYQTLKVSDTPSSEGSADRVKAVYKNHKRRLMEAARRESGDGAPAEIYQSKYARLSGMYAPMQPMPSPTRRLPVRDRLSLGPLPVGSNIINPHSAASHWTRLQSLSTKQAEANYDRLRPKFYSVKSSDMYRARSVSSPIDPLTHPRPSPEGVLNSAEKRPVQRCSCRRSTCEDVRYTATSRAPVHAITENLTQQITHQKNIATTAGKRVNRYIKKSFPKTPITTNSAAPSRDIQYPLETIDENGLVHIVMTPEHYNQHMKQMLQANAATSGQSRYISSQHSVASHHLKPKTHKRKMTASGLKDISRISHSSNSMHEQPSNVHLQGDFHSTFDYPLHSTMSYPLSSTMRNASLFPAEDGHEMSSIHIEPPKNSPATPNKLISTDVRKTHKDIANVGVKTHDLAPETSQTSARDFSPKDTMKSLSGFRSEAAGLQNNDSIQNDDTINATPKSHITPDQPSPCVPKTPVHVINSYYTLSYDSDCKTTNVHESDDCDSSYLSIDTDFKPVNDINKRQIEDFTFVTPTTNVHACAHKGTVTCRCHLKSVRRMRPFSDLRALSREDDNDSHLIYNQRPAPIGFSESTVFMDSQLREISPMEVDEASIHGNFNQTLKICNSAASQSNKQCTDTNNTNENSVDKKNNSHESNQSGKSSNAEGRGNLDFMSNMCNSIESIDECADSAMPNSIKINSWKSSMSSANTATTVIQVMQHESEKTKCDRDVMTRTHVESNCLNLGKILSVKGQRKETNSNITRMVNPNVTMVADGCLGFLRKNKNKPPTSKKAEKKSSKSCRFGIRGSKIKPDFVDQDEDKENTPSRSSPKRVNLPAISRKSAYAVHPAYHYAPTSRLDTTPSVVSSSYDGSCMDYEMKRKLSKRMRDFRRSALGESLRTSQQHLGHV